MEQTIVVVIFQLLNTAAAHHVHAVHETIEKHAHTIYGQLVGRVPQLYQPPISFQDHQLRLCNFGDTRNLEFTR
jgi:hypothetical protein